jgi:starch phosphorylase
MTPPIPEHALVRTDLTVDGLRRAVLDHLMFTRAKELGTATLTDLAHALAHTARDRLVYRWLCTERTYAAVDPKRVYYFSAEYLLGRQLEANLLNLGLYDIALAGLRERGISLEEILEDEEDPGLGNGGLGRLAACFLDSLAALELPAVGHGIRYEFGIFRQEIVHGRQVEQPDEWLRKGNPWEIARPEFTVPVGFGGRVEHVIDGDGRFQALWTPAHTVLGVPYDTPVAGFGPDNHTVNTLRLWSARASEQFDLAVFNDGDYRRAVEDKAVSESISKVLYPTDHSREGKALRLQQQYFFVCCAIADIVRGYRKKHGTFDAFPDKVAIQLNDTHPAIAVAELMRVLLDRHQLGWEEAWSITTRTLAYTNHTLLPEALERWPLELFEELLPRHLELIREIDRRFLREVHVFRPNDEALRQRMAIVEDGMHPHVRMAHLSVVGSHTVNGVAELHSRLLRERVLVDFAKLWPKRFTNVTNGVTPRRWLLQCNRRLTDAIATRIGPGFVTDLSELERLLPLVDDQGFLEELRQIKAANKEDFTAWLARERDIVVDPNSMFDVQVKRIHEYKRQLLAALHVVHLYRRMKFLGEDVAPRTVFIGGKAAPGYLQAKEHIKLIHDVAAMVNRDPETRDRLKLIYLVNYNVSLAERVIPAADLSEQVSMAGKEASGTGNMKFQINGALTIGTLDGANVEIREEVGEENFFLFGLDAGQARARVMAGYRPAQVIARSEALTGALSLLESGCFSPERPDAHREVVAYLREHDPFLVCADFDAYIACQERVAETYAQPERWWPMVAKNIAKSGRFSSDRTIREYAERIWGLERVPVALEPLET